jgi:hypothetical protein
MAITKKDIDALLSRYNSLKGDRGNWESYWSDLAQYVFPAEDEIYTFRNRTKGAEKNLRLYDSSAVHYNELLAAALHSMLTNAATNWFDLTTGDAEIDKQSEVTAWFQTLIDQMHLILNNSNFHSAAHVFYLGLGSFGSTSMQVLEDKEDVIRFKTEQVFTTYFDANEKGYIDTIIRPFKMKNRQILTMFGEEGFDEFELNDMKKNLDDSQELLQFLVPRSARDITKANAVNMPFASYVILEEKKKLLKESGYREQPFAVGRWFLATNEMYGRSPSMKTLPEIRMLQQIMRTTIRGASKIVDPPLLVPDDSVMAPNVRPGGLNSFRAGTENFIRPLQTGGNPGLGLDIMNDVRNRIKQGFFIDQLQLPEGPQKTATEVNALLQEQLRLFGPLLGRLENEFLKPVISRLLGIMKRKKLLPPGMPEAIAEADLKVRFSSQIAKAQRLSEAQGVEAFLMNVANVAQFKPEVLTMIDEKAYVKYSAKTYNVPMDIVRSDKEVKDIEEAQAEQGAKEQQLQEGQAEAAIAKDMSQAGG